MKEHYITAVCELLLNGTDTDTVLSSLLETLTKKGHLRIHKEILEGAIGTIARQQEAKKPTVTVASTKELEKMKKKIETTLKALDASIHDAKVIIDTSLVGGFVAVADGYAIDASHKQKLVTLYRNITT